MKHMVATKRDLNEADICLASDMPFPIVATDQDSDDGEDDIGRSSEASSTDVNLRIVIPSFIVVSTSTGDWDSEN